MADDDVETKLIAYANQLFESYADALDTNFPITLKQVRDLNQQDDYFPFYRRRVGEGIGLAVLFTRHDFYMFFLVDTGQSLPVLRDATDDAAFDRDWTFNTTFNIRSRRVKDELKISNGSSLSFGPDLECVCVPGTNFVAESVESMLEAGRSHGLQFGNQAGARADDDLPLLLATAQRKSKQAGFSERYSSLRDSTALSPQQRGQEFEILWREVMQFQGWHPKKVRIAGEENDFTAIYQGSHILGEVRWFASNSPMNGGKMREFLAKLDPRPQTIGLFVTHSGIDDGAKSVLRRAVNSKTVIVLDRDDIEAILLGRQEIHSIFNEKLREAYDFLFEDGQELG